MICLIPKTNFDFVKRRYIFFAISAVLVLGSIASIAIKGFNYGLDFSGGTLLQVQFKNPADTKDIREALSKNGIESEIQTYGDNSFAVRVKGSQENVNEIGDRIKGALGTMGNEYTVGRLEYVGPAVGRDLSKKAMWAMILSLFGIIIYIAFRFSNPLWGVTGVMGQFHDIIVVIGALSITGRELNLMTVAALLTIAGYSINDTIVIYDRMRENMHLNPRIKLYDLINLSINETMSRTVITVLTVFIATVFLYFMGGPVINDFAFAMLVGLICGVYSTVAVATSLLFQFSAESKTPHVPVLSGAGAKVSIAAENKPAAMPAVRKEQPRNKKNGKKRK
ncbi:MAG: protein translocase subunit SecF [Elusimicrobiaceae bacterium]